MFCRLLKRVLVAIECYAIVAAAIFLSAHPAHANTLLPSLAVGRNQNGQLDLFEVTSKGELRYRWRHSANGAWSGWSNLGGPVLPGLSVVQNVDGQMIVFAISETNGNLQFICQLAANRPKWSSWTNLGGNCEAPVASAQNADGRLEVFAIDAQSHNVRHRWQTSPRGSWSSWADLGGFIQPDLVVARNRDGRLELFGMPASGHELTHCWQSQPNTTNSWSEWRSLGGEILPRFVVGQNSIGRLEVFGRSVSDHSATRICQASASSSTNWSAWQSFGGDFKSDLAIGQSGDGRLEIFGVEVTNSTLLHRWENLVNGSDVWSQWKTMELKTASRPAVGTDEDGNLETFEINSTNSDAVLYRQQISASSDWLDWSSLERSAFDYTARAWQAGDGLPDNVVQAITQSPDGFLWVGTRSGLARFDGVDFTRFDPRNTPEIQNPSITALCSAGDGSLWIGTAGGGVARFQNGIFTHFGQTNGLAGDDIRNIYESNDGSLWIGTTTGLSRYRNRTFVTYKEKDGLLSDSVTAICWDRDENLWVATTKGLSRLRKGGVIDSFAMPNRLPNDTVRSILQDKGGRIWIGSNNGLLWYDQYWGNHFFAYNTKYGLSDVFVSAICEGHDGNLWVGTYSGLNRFYESRFYPQLDNEGQPFSKVNALCEDTEGDLWVGTQEGLIRLSRKYFYTYTQQTGLTHNNVMSVLQDRRGILWMGTWGGGIDQINGEEVTPYSPTNSLSHELILSMCESRDGTMWVGADFDRGLTHIKEGALVHYTSKNGLPNARIQVLAEDQNRNLWIGTSAGLSCRSKGIFRNYTERDGLAGNNVRAILEDHAGTLWFGTDGGLSSWKDGRFTHVTTDDSLSENSIIALHEDAQGSIWIGTDGGGLSRYRNGRFDSCTTQQGLFSDTIFSILDEDGWLWMSCPQGIFRVRIAELTDLDAGNIKSVSCIPYGKTDGMETAQCNGAGKPSAWKSSDNKLWFATSKGLVCVDPQMIILNPFEPTVYVEQLIADRKPHLSRAWPQLLGNDQTLIHIPPTHGELQFQYTALCLSAPEKARFKYKLDGITSDWVDAGERRTAYFNNIPPGQYEFHVKGCNKDGVWNERGASVGFVLTPYYWQTPWFHWSIVISAGGLIAGLITTATRRRMRRRLQILEQQQAIEKERGRIARDMHDQLGAGLTQISLLGEFARRDESGSGKAKAHVEKICDLTRELAQTVDEIVWTVNPRNDALNKFAAYLASYAEDYFHATNIRCRLDIPSGLPSLPLSAEVRHSVFLVIKEGLNNIVKHANASVVWIRLALEDSDLVIRIEDDGVGFSIEEGDHNGNGIRNMNERLRELGGILEIISQPHQGTRVCLRVPINSRSNKSPTRKRFAERLRLL